ncbi:hypothetical protein VitviT2T_008942 [Vitis vinifera]|uniref:Uncharacterized protein n=1 Tax=Vitis vinifera TaxID=29760 RepID=A0ABY9C426_VITVI|nr:hypothetical protein VitviT2T_008942 [Vitis vinifera]
MHDIFNYSSILLILLSKKINRSPRSRAAEIFNVGLGYHHRMLRTCWFFSSHVLCEHTSNS